MFYSKKILGIHLALALLCSCTHQPHIKIDVAHAVNHGFKPMIFFFPDQNPIAGLIKNNRTVTAHVYIEGDGCGWANLTTPSDDPTPNDGVGIKLAYNDQSKSSVVYLSRPGQFIKNHHFTQQDWTNDRYRLKIIKGYDHVLEQIKGQYGIKKFKFFAYSGGAMIALLLAAMRRDVIEITTFAGLLDHERWSAYHRYTPLLDNLCIHDTIHRLGHIKQRHYIGQWDQEVPLVVSDGFFRYFKNNRLIRHEIVPQYHHYSDWASFWKQRQCL